MKKITSFLYSYWINDKNEIIKLIEEFSFREDSSMIQEAVKKLGTADYYAVRSSARAEDSEKFSFAGQLDSFLYVKKEFQIDDEDILNGIRYHTVGRKGMSQIEKIVYLADAIEEGRDYEGVQEIRELAYKNLDKAILMEANHKIKYLIDIGVVLHPNTVEMRNWILKVIKEEEK